MNYIKHLTGFFEKVVTDKTLNPTHISLYMALFQFWNCNRFKNPISINRDEVMRISKISSKATYHKCLKNLHGLGYINYEPSYNPFKGSHVIMFNFSEDLKPENKSVRKLNNEPIIEPAIEQVLNKSYTGHKTSDEQALVPSINNTNNSNNQNLKNDLNLRQKAKKNEGIEISNFDGDKEKKLREKKKSPHDPINNLTEDITADKLPLNTGFSENLFAQNSTPTLDIIQAYFQKNEFPVLEAQKFFNYFASVGWLVGGKTPMVNWQAAAQNWMLNSVNFNQNTEIKTSKRANQLNITIDKDYAEPL